LPNTIAGLEADVVHGKLELQLPIIVVVPEGHNSIAAIKLFEFLYYSIDDSLDVLRRVAICFQLVANFFSPVFLTESPDFDVCSLTISGDG